MPVATDRLHSAHRRIDRRAVVDRHRVRLTALDPHAPLQVGNGEFACSVDITGLQTFPESYPVDGGGTLLGTQAQWGWHTLPSDHPYRLCDTFWMYDTPAGPAPYPDLTGQTHDSAAQTPAETWLRGNPHRLDLGRIGLWTGGDVRAEEVREVDQQLDLWSGIIDSAFTLRAERYRVVTAAHPKRDAVGVSVDGPPDATAGLRLRFPYGSQQWGNAADWSRPDAHRTTIEPTTWGWRVRRALDGSTYWVAIAGPDLELVVLGEHDLVVCRPGTVDVTVEFGLEPAADPLGRSAAVFDASRTGWERFWMSGAAVDLAGSDSAGAGELERRIVLSQYLTAVNCAGSLPPAETGLMLSSWRGKFHLEMHWFHGAHFAAWNRPDQLERSMRWYETIRPKARETARRQHLTGARWPKQVGPDGGETPSSIGPFLIWQQPHPIYLAELFRRARPGRETIERWSDVVFDSAEFMAGYAAETSNGFELGPPVVPAQESYFETRAAARNPTFELAYWSWALDVAAQWRHMLGLEVPQRWTAVSRGLVAPHRVDGVYAGLGTPPYLIREDHPNMLAALGFLPPTRLIDPGVMNATFDDVWNDWDWETTWGWDYPVAAMTATRLGRPDDATAALLRGNPKNTYLANGHNFQTPGLPIYLPGNGALLMAVAMMAAGWDGSGRPSPGFGDGWHVRHEDFVPLP